MQPIENSETPKPSKTVYMRGYMVKRRIAKKFGWTVGQWEAAGSPIPSGGGEGIAAQKESPVEPPDAA